MKKLFLVLSVSILMLATSSIFAENNGNEFKNQKPSESKKDIQVMGIRVSQSDGEIWCWPSPVIRCVTIHVPDYGKGSKVATIFDKNGESKTIKIKDYSIFEVKGMTVVKLVR